MIKVRQNEDDEEQDNSRNLTWKIERNWSLNGYKDRKIYNIIRRSDIGNQQEDRIQKW